MQSKDIRNAFLSFFHKHHHHRLQSASLMPDDPTLLFTSAGMVPLKDFFLDIRKPPYTRLTNIQKCLRAGGKHNDLDAVGKTARHHTFFEMCGNFSIGDYFKEQAIFYAYNFIWKELNIDPKRLYVTVYADDLESISLWSKLIPKDTIIPINTSDNFWSMGKTGPCGPCTEIFYDHGNHVSGGLPGTQESEGDRFVEIWNLVFMQYNQVIKNDETILQPLKHQSVDTGMGLERITAVMKGVVNNFDTDLFQPLIKRVSDITGKNINFDQGVHHRILADHIRACVFLISEGLTPSNEAQGYVLRRIIRRAIIHANALSKQEQSSQILSNQEGVLSQLVPTMVHMMQDVYPDLKQNQAFVEEQLNLEEHLFRTTLHAGLSLLSKSIQHKTPGVFPGKTAFTLLDTYGFPFDLTQQVLESKGWTINKEDFQEQLDHHIQKSKWNTKSLSTQQTILQSIDKLIQQPTVFLGYDHITSQAQCILIVDEQEHSTTKIQHDKSQTPCFIILNQTPFYAESGGQIGDRGEIRSDRGIFKVCDTKKTKGGIIVHKGHMIQGYLAVQESVHAVVNHVLRNQTAKHHSSAHLLHKALQERFGRSTVQQGSWIGYNKARLDFSYNTSLTDLDIQALEKQVNDQIQKNIPVSVQEMSYDESLKTGALALFDEKYGSRVRVVSMGCKHAENSQLVNKNQHPYSIELCGGIHVKYTGDIGLFSITKTGSIKAGTKRIEWVVGASALHAHQHNKRLLTETIRSLKTSPAQLLTQLNSLMSHKQIPNKKEIFKVQTKDTNISHLQKSYPLRFLFAQQMPPNHFKGYMDDHAQNPGLTVFLNQDNKKISLVIKSIQSPFSATQIAKKIATYFSGTGGGRDNLAQAGFQTDTSFEKIKKIVQDIIIQL